MRKGMVPRFSRRSALKVGLLSASAFDLARGVEARGTTKEDKPAPPNKLLSRSSVAPVYVRNEQDESKWPQMIRAGIDTTRLYFGNYGPVYVYILGHEDKTLNSDTFHESRVAAYCRQRGDEAGDQFEFCKSRKGAELIKKANSGRGDAYLSFVDTTDPPIAELVFINPHEFHDPYLYTRGIHEYTHVFQRSFPTTPTWMMEGGAEFFACYLGEKRGWANFRDDMLKFMQNVRRIEDPRLGIQDMEDVDKVSPEVKKYYRHLAYDAGAWAFAFMIYKSESRRVADVPKKFYPLVAENGWERTLAEFTNFDNKQAFYAAFAEFLKKPSSGQAKILAELAD